MRATGRLVEAIGIQVVIATNVSLLSYKVSVFDSELPELLSLDLSVSGAPRAAQGQGVCRGVGAAEQPAGHRLTHKGSGAQISSRKKPLNSWGLRLGSWCGAVAMASMAFL